MAVVVVAILMAASWDAGRRRGESGEERELSPERVDTMQWIDTVKAVAVEAVESEVVKREVKRLRLADRREGSGRESELSELSELSEQSEAEGMVDSVDVVEDIERKVYTDSSTYRAVVSGAWVSLDTIEVWNRHENVSVVRRESGRDKRWSVGVGVGYGWNGRGWSPYAGVTVSYRLWEF